MVRVPDDIIVCLDREGAVRFIERVWGLEPVFVCVIGTTDTAKIPGISAAGRNPEMTDYTPAADVEYLFYGECQCIEGVPVTPEGIPTPALITKSAVDVAGIPVFVVNAGVRVRPDVPYIDVGGVPGDDIRTGRAVRDPDRVFRKAVIVGRGFGRVVDYLVVGESIPGGTTTALGVLLAMGVDAEGRVSSSMPENPHELKVGVVREGLAAAGIRPGDLRDDPLRAVSVVGDPMMAAFAGLVAGAAEEVPVLMAGGTQMVAILAILKVLRPDVLGNVAIGTTRWIVRDRTSDLEYLVSCISRVPVLAANLDFSCSRYGGLQMYERGAVKEGVGAGGAVIASILKSRGGITCRKLLEVIEENYGRIFRSFR